MSFRHYFYTSGEPWNGIRNWLVPRVLYTSHALVMGSAQFSYSGHDRARPFREREENGRGAIFVTWHDETFPYLYLLERNDLTAISSQSRSARLHAAWLKLMGIHIVWGSAGKREGIAALRQFLPILKKGRIILIAPDGPKGPRHRAEPGVLFMASRTGVLIYPWGIAADPAWRLKTWDRHLIPKPFARIHVHMGAPIEVPSTLPREDIESWRQIVDDALNDAQRTAEEKLAARTQARKTPLKPQSQNS